jgi:1-acyl-sn-glycerol-3-phosphate acyltransferase
MPRINALYYYSWRYLLRVIVPILTRIEVRGLEHVPRSGPAILVGNHISMTDPPILIGFVPRHITFIIKSELYSHLFYRLLLPLGKPIAVRRGRPDRAALRKAEAVLKSGGLLSIYPEGTRNLSGAMQEAHSGIIFLAQRTGAPIVPVAISGTEGIFRPRFPWYRRARVRLAFGRPFTLAELQAGERVNREELAHTVMLRVAELLPPRYRGVYGTLGNREQETGNREDATEERVMAQHFTDSTGG